MTPAQKAAEKIRDAQRSSRQWSDKDVEIAAQIIDSCLAENREETSKEQEWHERVCSLDLQLAAASKDTERLDEALTKIGELIYNTIHIDGSVWAVDALPNEVQCIIDAARTASAEK